MYVTGRTRWLLRIGTGITLAFIYIPLLVILLYAFNAKRVQTWPIDEWTTEWFDKAINNPVVSSANGGLTPNTLLDPATGLVLVFGGVQMIMLGVIGEYLWRTLEQARTGVMLAASIAILATIIQLS